MRTRIPTSSHYFHKFAFMSGSVISSGSVYNARTHTHTHPFRGIHNIYIDSAQRPQKYLAGQCKWFTALNVLFMRLFNSERGASCALLSYRSSIIWFVYYVNFACFCCSPCCLSPSLSHSLHTNIKLQNYHLCNSCGNTNKSQFYGAQFFCCCSSSCFISFLASNRGGGAPIYGHRAGVGGCHRIPQFF